MDINPFDYDADNKWEEYFAPGGKVIIIQLAGYDQDEMKRLMEEFMLWDLWYYTQDGAMQHQKSYACYKKDNVSLWGRLCK